MHKIIYSIPYVDPTCYPGSETGSTGRCYIPLLEHLTWPEAAMACRLRGTTMVTVRDDRDWDDLVRFGVQNRGLGQQSYWLGASTLDWKWQSGTLSLNGNK